MTLPRSLPLVFILAACGADPSPRAPEDAPADVALDASADVAPAGDAPSCTRDDGLPVAANCNGFACVLLTTPGNCGACGASCGVGQACARNGGAFACRTL